MSLYRTNALEPEAEPAPPRKPLRGRGVIQAACTLFIGHGLRGAERIVPARAGRDEEVMIRAGLLGDDLRKVDDPFVV